MPKVYGSPTGTPKPDPKRQQRAATPASPQQVDDYISHMVKADSAFHAQKKASAPPPMERTHGSSQTGKTKYTSVPGVDAAVDRGYK
jgi:hypothetical protein